MTGIGLAVLAATAFAAAVLITGSLRRYALKRSLIDQPNSRSAHEMPTPRGGGLAIVLVFVGALGVVAASGGIDLAHALAIAGAGLIVGLVGFVDDHGHLAARWRLLAHFTAAVWLLGWLGLPASVVLVGLSVPAPVAHATAAVLIVWMINLYNFMDGIDGIASLEAITVAFGGTMAAVLTGHWALAPLQLLLAATVSGFLVWNWPPATIFMGDSGSGFLGVVIGAIILLSAHAEPTLLFAWLILLGVFFVDSAVTLLRRAVRGERLYEAHRMHAYQHAVRRLRSHARVTLTVAAINLFWLLPLALAAVVGLIPALLALMIAYLPLTALAWWWRAGCPIEPPLVMGTSPKAP